MSIAEHIRKIINLLALPRLVGGSKRKFKNAKKKLRCFTEKCITKIVMYRFRSPDWFFPRVLRIKLTGPLVFFVYDNVSSRNNSNY